jgi:hypothetical protein
MASRVRLLAAATLAALLSVSEPVSAIDNFQAPSDVTFTCRARDSGALAEVSTTVVTVDEQQTLATVLRRHKVQPSREAFVLVEDLNPELTEPVRGAVKIPVAALPEGQACTIAANVDLREELSLEVKRLSSVTVHDTALVSASRELALVYESLIRRFNDDGAVPIRRPTLFWLVGEARLAREIVAADTDSGQGLKLLASVTQDVRNEIVKQDDVMGPAGLEPRAKVTVTLTSMTGAPVQPLRVYYTLAGLMPDNAAIPAATLSFMKVGETVSELLPIKDYKVWAAPEGEPRRVLTGVVDVRARARNDGDEVPVTLLVKSSR